MEVTESLLAGVPLGNLRVPRAEFAALWAEAERLNREQTGRPDSDWYPAAVAVTCRWLAGAVVENQVGRRALAPAPVTRRRVRAYEELIEADPFSRGRACGGSRFCAFVQLRADW